MARDVAIEEIWADVMAEKKYPKLRQSRYRRAFANPNDTTIDMYHRYDRYDDDYISTIEKHGKITGSRCC